MTRNRRSVDPLWTNAPLVLFHYPRLFASVALGAFLLCLVVAAEPLYLSSEAGVLVTRKIDEPAVTRYGAGLLFQLQVEPGPFLPPGGRGLGSELAEIGREFSQRTRGVLGPTITAELGAPVTASAEGSSTPKQIALFAGTDELHQVDVVQRGSGPGVWLADVTARALGVSPGDRITISNGDSGDVQVPIAGIYRALVNAPRTGYWRPLAEYIDPRCVDCEYPPPFALVDPASVDRLLARLGIHSTIHTWQAPVAAGAPISLADAQAISAVVSRFEGDAGRPSSVFSCCRPRFIRGNVLSASISSAMPGVFDSVQRDMVSLETSAEVLLVAGIIVAMIVITAAATFGLSTRKVEAQLLFSRGAHPVSVAARAGLESVLPVAAGGVAGLGLSLLLIRVILSEGRVSSPVIAEAVSRAALAGVGAIALIGLVSGVAFVRNTASRRFSWRSVSHLPWELALVGLAGYCFSRIQSGGAFVQVAHSNLRRPSFYLLLFPVLGIAGLGTLAARLFRMASAILRERSAEYRSWAYLAIRRLAGGGPVVLILVAASVLCFGVFVQAEATVRSLRATVDAKAHLFVGSDVQAQAAYDTRVPEGFPLPVTKVTFVPEAGTFTPGGATFDLLAIDPTTFGRAAFWDAHLSEQPLSDVLSRLSTATGSSVPLAIAGNATASVDGLMIEGRAVPIDVVARPEGFPGMLAGVPLVVVDPTTLLRYLDGVANPLIETPGATTELWVKGSEYQATSALAAVGFDRTSVTTATQIEDIPEIAAVIQSLEVLRLLALGAALLVIIATIGYLAARQRSQVVSYGLSLRMGMSHADHRRSIAAELGSMLCSASVIGVCLGVVAALALVPKLDPLSTIPPGPIFVLPRILIAVTFAVAIAASWFGASLTNRRARALDLGEVMRLGG